MSSFCSRGTPPRVSQPGFSVSGQLSVKKRTRSCVSPGGAHSFSTQERCGRASRPSGRARCGAGAGCSAIKYQSLPRIETSRSELRTHSLGLRLTTCWVRRRRSRPPGVSTLHPRSSTLNPPPSILHPPPSTLNPQLSTLNSQPSTLNPQPSILHPPPSTLNPQPCTLTLAHEH